MRFLYLTLLNCLILTVTALGQQLGKNAHPVPKKQAIISSEHHFPKTEKKVSSSIRGHEQLSRNQPYSNNDNFHSKSAAVGIKVGESKYDLQTNSSMQRRIVVDPEGTVHMTWTKSVRTDFTTRGTGYNYVTADGTVGPTLGELETERNGWPDIDQTASGRLVKVSHLAGLSSDDPSGLYFSYKDPDDSDWTHEIMDIAASSNTWARIAASGETIHIIAAQAGDFPGSIACDVPGGLHYYRSTDGGNTWDVQQSCLVDANGDNIMSNKNFSRISGDGYAMDVNGNQVAIVVGTFVPTLIFSEDGGDTWQMQRLIEVEDPLYSGLSGQVADVTSSTDESYSIVIDDDGTIHVWFAILLLEDADPSPSFSYYPTFNGIQYWNSSWGEATEPKTIGQTVRHDLDGDSTAFYDSNVSNAQAYSFQLVSTPSGAYDDDGNLYMAYRSIVEGHIDGNGENYSDVFLVKSEDNGASWIGPYNLTNSPDNEEVFAAIARKVVNDQIHLVYQSDALVSNTIEASHPNNPNGYVHDVVTNDIMYVAVPTSDIQTPEEGDAYYPLLTYPSFFPFSAFFGFENCPYDVEERIVYFCVDYPDGDLPLQASGEFLENLDNPGGPYQLDIKVEDSDGLEITASFESMYVLEDTEVPYIELNPYDAYFFTENGDTISVLGFYTSTGLFLLDPDSVFFEIDIVQGSDWEPLGAEIIDDAESGGCSATLQVVDNVNPDIVGTYKVCYNGRDFVDKEAEEVCRIVNVIPADVTAPEIVLFGLDGEVMESEDTIYISASQDVWVDPGYYAFDRVDLEISNQVTVGGDEIDLQKVNVYRVEYQVSDQAGNQATAIRYVEVGDFAPPVVDVPGNIAEPWVCGDSLVIPPGTSAFDIVDGDLSDQIEITFSITCNGTTYDLTDFPVGFQGNVDVFFTVTDASGNVGFSKKVYALFNYTTDAACPALCEEDSCVSETYCITSITPPAIARNEIQLYPNPNAGAFNIRTTNHYENVQIEIFNVSGRLIFKQNKPSLTDKVYLELDQMNTGVYMVKITTSEGIWREKFIVH